jgi:hypothetical protein
MGLPLPRGIVGGGSAPSIPVCPPSLAEGLPAFWAPPVGGVTRVGYSPLFKVLWGDTPHSHPGPSRLPTLVSLGFASALGPTRGVVTGVGNSPPLLVFGGTSPKPPARGLCPLDPLANPRRLKVCRRFGSYPWRGDSSNEDCLVVCGQEGLSALPEV